MRVSINHPITIPITAVDVHGRKVGVGQIDLTVLDRAQYEELLAASKPQVVTTAEELDALGQHAVVRDDENDIWERRGDVWCSYETEPASTERMAKRYGPFVVFTATSPKTPAFMEVRAAERERVAVHLENLRQPSGMYGQHDRKITNYQRAADDVRALGD